LALAVYRLTVDRWDSVPVLHGIGGATWDSVPVLHATGRAVTRFGALAYCPTFSQSFKSDEFRDKEGNQVVAVKTQSI